MYKIVQEVYKIPFLPSFEVLIPYRFLFRDGWEDIDTVEENMELLEIDSVVENKGLIKKFIESTVQGKNRLITKMKEATLKYRRDIITERDLLRAVADREDG